MSKSPRNIPPEVKMEFEDFRSFFGGAGNNRKYGRGEILGLILNLGGNRFLKRTGQSESRKYGEQTREAFYAKVDLKAGNKKERDYRIIGAFPQKEATEFRVKDIKYGNHNAMWEVLASHLYGLTGLAGPDNMLLVHDGYEERENGAPKVFVASPIVTGYHDLGEFLIDRSALKFITKENHQECFNLRAKIKAIGDRAIVGEEDKLERINLYSKIYAMLPDYFHQEIEKAFAGSKFIGNWDFANLSLSNIGCKFTLDRDNNVIGLESVFVDFGNSGAIGFGGKFKEASFERANKEARPQETNPNNYDPRLTFTDPEIRLLKEALVDLGKNPEDIVSADYKVRNAAINAALIFLKGTTEYPEVITPTISAGDFLNELETIGVNKAKRTVIKSVMFKCSHHILPTEASMDVDTRTTGLLTVGDLPRNIPFSPILKSVIKRKTREVDETPDPIGIHQNYSMYQDSEMEIAFRMALIPDWAIDTVVKKWFLAEQFPNVFPIPEQFKKDPKYNSPAGVAGIFKKRRDDLVASIPKKIIDEWVRKNPITAIAAEQEVRLAIFAKSHIANQDFDFDRDEPAIGPKGPEFIALSEEFSFAARAGKGVERSEQALFLEDIKAQIKDFEDNKIEKDLSKEECWERVIDFIESSSSKWKYVLGLSPNCSLFNIKMIRQNCQLDIYDFTNGSIMSENDRVVRNAGIHEVNTRIYDKFMGNLDKVIDALKPRTAVKKKEMAEAISAKSVVVRQEKIYNL